MTKEELNSKLLLDSIYKENYMVFDFGNIFLSENYEVEDFENVFICKKSTGERTKISKSDFSKELEVIFEKFKDKKMYGKSLSQELKEGYEKLKDFINEI